MIGCLKIHSIKCPIGLFLPNRIISKKPKTVGGKTKGYKKIVSISAFPFNFLFAITFPKVNPKTITISVETRDVLIERIIGEKLSAVISINEDQ